MANKEVDLILGAVRGYDFAQLRPFITSLRRTSYDGEIVLLWNALTEETRARLEEHGVRLVHFSYRGSGAENSWSRFWPVLRPVMKLPLPQALRRAVYRRILNLAFVRFVHELDFLERDSSRFRNIMLTDVRDVIFQDNPFRDPLPSALVGFLEAPKMRFGFEPRFNDPWVRTNYNEAVLQRLFGCGISCCGTIMGTASAIRIYLRAFVAEIRKLSSLVHGADTSVHNVLVREVLRDRFAVQDNFRGTVATLGNEADGRLIFSQDGLLSGEDGRPVPVIHQCPPDKLPRLVRALNL